MYTYLPYFKIEILTTRQLTTSFSFEQLGPGHIYVFANNVNQDKTAPDCHSATIFYTSSGYAR